MADKTGGDVFDRQQAESFLYPGKGLPGGGQLEVRMEVSADHPDPDVRGVARRVKYFNLESWHKEWTEVANKIKNLQPASSGKIARLPLTSFARAADLPPRCGLHAGDRPAHAADLQEA
jgi:hypothetical protein